MFSQERGAKFLVSTPAGKDGTALWVGGILEITLLEVAARGHGGRAAMHTLAEGGTHRLVIKILARG